MSEQISPFDPFFEKIREIVREEIAAALNGNVHAQERGDYLTPEQAAKIMGVEVNWLYRHRKKLPFAHGASKKVLRFDEIGLRRWMTSRK
jgi:Helix-turn-helix domain